jgi:hypothetical protein
MSLGVHRLLHLVRMCFFLWPSPSKKILDLRVCPKTARGTYNKKRSINIEKLLKTNLISINRPPTENILPFQTLNRFFGTFFYLSPPSALGPFEFIEFLRNQILKIDGPLNGAVFLWFLETRNSIF